MPRPSLPLLRLSELTVGQPADFFAVLADRIRGATREGKPYFTCRFRDDRRSATYMVWADGPHFADCDQTWKEGTIYKIRGQLIEHDRYGLQLEVHKIREVIDSDECDRSLFVGWPRSEPAEVLAELLALVERELADAAIRQLVRTLLERHAETLLHLPASPRNFYPYPGGWLEHTRSVAQLCLLLADRYRAVYSDLRPPLNRDLLLAGAVLHDLGRVAECDAGGEATIPGRLFGHLILGRDLVRDLGRELGVDAEWLTLLEHLILTHLNWPEWGSPRLPLIPECLILHHADDLDAKLEVYVRCLQRDPGAGPFTERDPVLGKSLLKGRTV